MRARSWFLNLGLCLVTAGVGSACGGTSPSAETTVAETDVEPDTTAPEPVAPEPAESAEPADTETETETAEAEPAEPTEPAEPDFSSDPIREASMPLLEAIAEGEVALERVTEGDDKGLVLVDHYKDGGEDVIRARHYCYRFLSNHFDDIREQLQEDLARGRELNDMACNPTFNPERIDCSIGGTENKPVSHYIFEETDEGVRLEAVLQITEIGESDRYVSRAHSYAERQLGRVRENGCPEP